METVIGLGNAGCNIADKFSKYSQYKIYKIDTDIEVDRDNVYKMPRQEDPEKYEENCPNMSNFFKDVQGEVLFVIGGAGAISAASLRVLETIKHCDINILYIRPEVELLPAASVSHEWATFNILQEYTRSGVFKRIYLVSNPEIERHLGNVSIIGYHERLNEMIVSTMHMINVYNHINPVTSTLAPPRNINRISTIGIMDIDDGEKKLFFPLDETEEIMYYYAINKSKLEEEGDLFKKIREQVKSDLKVGYGIFATDYVKNYVYVVSHTSEIQRQKSEKNT